MNTYTITYGYPGHITSLSPMENMFVIQIRMGPSYSISASDNYDGPPYDSSDNDDQPIHFLAAPGARSKKKAYNVYWGRKTGTFKTWNSAEIQVKHFSGACFKGYSSVEEAIAEWDIAVAAGHIGPDACHRRRDILQPFTQSRTRNFTPSHGPISMPSRGSSALSGPSNTSLRGLSSTYTLPASQTATCTTPTRSKHAPAMTSPPSTPVCPAACASSSALSPSSPSSLSDSTQNPPATPSSRGSAARFAAITEALEGLNIDAYYAVIRGRKPGVYTSSSAALAATGSDVRGLCCMVATRELANAMFVEYAMAGNIEQIL